MPRDIEKILPCALETFHARSLHCAETVLKTMAEYWQVDMTHIPHIATAFGGGIAGLQRECGAFNGGLMAIGLIYGRDAGGDREAAYAAAKAFIEWFESARPRVCREITGVDLTDPAQKQQFSAPGGGHETVCEPLVAEVARYLARTLPIREGENT